MYGNRVCKGIHFADFSDNKRMVCMSGLVLLNIELQYINFCHLAKFIIIIIIIIIKKDKDNNNKFLNK